MDISLDGPNWLAEVAKQKREKQRQEAKRRALENAKTNYKKKVRERKQGG